MTSEVWFDEGETNERCFEVEYRISSDEYHGRVVPEIEIETVTEDGTELSDTVFAEFKDRLYDKLYEMAEED